MYQGMESCLPLLAVSRSVARAALGEKLDGHLNKRTMDTEMVYL